MKLRLGAFISDAFYFLKRQLWSPKSRNPVGSRSQNESQTAHLLRKSPVTKVATSTDPFNSGNETLDLYGHFAPSESEIHRATEDKSSLEIQNDEMLISEM